MALRAVATAAIISCKRTPRNPYFQSIPYNIKPKIPPFPLHQSGSKFAIRTVSEAAAADPIAPKKKDEEPSPENWKIKMLYDGDCPLCMREVDMLRERNERFGTIKFVDISSDDYSPEENQGLDYKTVMGRIHAILSDGTVVTDVELGLQDVVGLDKIIESGAITPYLS